jgi:hypothetical protein
MRFSFGCEACHRRATRPEDPVQAQIELGVRDCSLDVRSVSGVFAESEIGELSGGQIYIARATYITGDGEVPCKMFLAPGTARFQRAWVTEMASCALGAGGPKNVTLEACGLPGG